VCAALLLLGAMFNTKLLFVAAIAFCVAVGFDITRGIVQQFRRDSKKGILTGIIEAVPLSSVLLLVCAFLYLVLHELLPTQTHGRK
jgi:hypothetical protein